MITHASFYFSSLLTSKFCRSHNIWIFYWLFVRVFQEKRCYCWRFLEILMKNHTMIIKSLSEHIIMVTSILHFLSKRWYLKFFKNIFISQNYPYFKESRVSGSEHFLWKFEFDHIIFLDSTGIGSVKCNEILYRYMYYSLIRYLYLFLETLFITNLSLVFFFDHTSYLFLISQIQKTIIYTIQNIYK